MLLFDIDSTLLKDGGASGKAFDQAFQQIFSISPISVDKYGKTDSMIAQETAQATLGRSLTPHEEQQLLRRYEKELPYYLSNTENFIIFPGVEPLCRKIKSILGFAVGIQTGNLELAAWAKLEKARIRDAFSFGGFGSDAADRTGIIQKAIQRGFEKFKGLSKDSVVYVFGDSPFDMIAGNQNNAVTIGVPTGKTAAEGLKAAGAVAVIEGLGDTEGIINLLKHLKPQR